MILSLGPVMRYELITTARRRRYYFLRVIYCSFLLAQLWIFFTKWEAEHQSGGSRDEIQAFAEDAFIQFAGAQGIGLLLLIPALVAGIISDEYQRKTLHYLLASRLSSAEIVLGKMGARMVHVVAFIALGLPIVSLLMLYGGLNPVNIFYVYMGTATLVLFVSGFSVLISILARRPRDAILATYGLGAIWLLVPIWIQEHFGLSRRHALVGTSRERRPAHEQSHPSLVDVDSQSLQLGRAEADAGRRRSSRRCCRRGRQGMGLSGNLPGWPAFRRSSACCSSSWRLRACVRFAAARGPGRNRRPAEGSRLDDGERV